MPDPLATLAILSALHGDLDVLHLEMKPGAIHVPARCTSPAPHCPDCQTLSNQVHGGYVRTLADLAHQGTPVRLRLRVRRFRCTAPRYPRRTFTERLPTLAARHARRTVRLPDMIGRVGMALGGQAGARLLPTLGARASADTVLRMVRRMHAPVLPTPRGLGVDEWASRKGHVYGTILVDLERRVVVDVLPERSAESLTNWLVQHPGVEIISRDRLESYAEGARRGAPEAVQVADRWHLLKDLGDRVERVCNATAGSRIAPQRRASPWPRRPPTARTTPRDIAGVIASRAVKHPDERATVREVLRRPPRPRAAR